MENDFGAQSEIKGWQSEIEGWVDIQTDGWEG
jgi:hypothetical protein